MTNISVVEKISELMQQIEVNSPRVAALHYCLSETARHIAELEQKLAESQREFRAADATIKNLQMQVEKLAAENAGLKSFGDKLCSMYKGLETSGGGFHDEQSIPYQQAALDAAISAFEEIKTPETDASMAELRAQGVEMFAKEMHADISGDDAREFAAQLRKGGATEEKQSFLSDEDCHAFVEAFTKGATQ
ncbi:hypothetical protein ACT024_10345 [Enterobacter mori]|uniref:hypothetical protein n=1 Tax=Enterobacter mori TaxID=539813 RepID=UPI00402A65DD